MRKIIFYNNIKRYGHRRETSPVYHVAKSRTGGEGVCQQLQSECGSSSGNGSCWNCLFGKTVSRCLVYAIMTRKMTKYIIVDGFSPLSGAENLPTGYEREKGMLPVVVIDKDLSNTYGEPTIRHNRARGTHDIGLMMTNQPMSKMTQAGMSDKWIMKNIGMDKG